MKRMKLAIMLAFFVFLIPNVQAQFKSWSNGHVDIGHLNNPQCRLHISGGNAKTETRLWAEGDHISRYWAVNYKLAYSFGVDESGYGRIWGDINVQPSPIKLLTFANSWIHASDINYACNFKYLSIGPDLDNRIHKSNKGSHGVTWGYEFDGNYKGLIFESFKQDNEPSTAHSSGIYLGERTIQIWSPGSNANGDIATFHSNIKEDGRLKAAFRIKKNGQCMVQSNTTSSQANTSKNDTLPVIHNALTSVLQLQGIIYEGNPEPPAKNGNSYEIFTETINGHIAHIDTVYSTQDEEHKKSKTFELSATSLESVFPELVDTDENDNKFIDYMGMVPVLVEALKDLQEELEKLKHTYSNLLQQLPSEGSNPKSTAEEEEVYDEDIMEPVIYMNSGGQANTSTYDEKTPVLYQNIPNPFNRQTEIRFFLPDYVRFASIYIYDMQGAQIKSITISQRGDNRVSIHASELKAGMYFYTLIADQKEIGTKKMILTD